MPVRDSPEADAQLDALQLGPDAELWNAVCDALDLIVDRPDSAEARREAIVTAAGRTIWMVPVRHSSLDDVVVLWAVENDIEYVLYVGPMPPRATAP